MCLSQWSFSRHKISKLSLARVYNGRIRVIKPSESAKIYVTTSRGIINIRELRKEELVGGENGAARRRERSLNAKSAQLA